MSNILIGWLLIGTGAILMFGLIAYSLWFKLKYRESVSSLLGFGSIGGVIGSLGFAVILANSDVDMATVAGESTLKLLVVSTVMALAFGVAAASFLRESARQVPVNK